MTIQYIIQAVGFQLIFLMIYDLLLKRETFFNANRSYLILTPVISLLLPFIRLEALRSTVPEEVIVQLPAILIGSSSEVINSGSDSVFQAWNWIWISGIVVSAVFLLLKLLRFRATIKRSIAVGRTDLNLRVIPNSNMAFSFLQTVYLGDQLTDEQKEHILQHELVHVRERHSIDLILFELMKLVLWFNPMVYIYQRRLSVLHEYIADRDVALRSSRKRYYEQLLAQTFQTDKISFINTFFKHSLIKKRIIMLNRSNSKKSASFRYLLLLPILAGMLIYTSCAQETPVVAGEKSETNDFSYGSDSEIMDNIASLKEAIAAKGEMTEAEQKALKSLYVITSEEGVNNFYFDDIHEEIEVPFGVIHKVPTYPGCEGLENAAAQKCFTTKVTEFVVQEFNADFVKGDGLSGRQRIAVQFTISDNGQIENIKAKSPHPALTAEAVRVIELLPAMVPGEHDGKKVNVSFALPIIFEM